MAIRSHHTKHPAAVALGKLGGAANTEAQRLARSKPKGGGRPMAYRWMGDQLEKRLPGGEWVRLDPPYDATTKRWIRKYR